MEIGWKKGTGVGILLVFLTALVSGVSTFVNFWAAAGSNTDAFITVRNGLVALLLVPIVLLARQDVRTRLRRVDWARLATIGLVGGAIPFLLFFRGIQMSRDAAGLAGAATATFGYRTLFLVATALAVVYLKEKVSWRIAVAAGALLGGNVLLLSFSAPVWTDGTMYVLAATALWAGEYALSKRALRDLPGSTVALGRMGFGAVYLAGYVALTSQMGAVAALSGEQYRWMAVSAILLLAFVTTWYHGLKHVDLSVATAALVLGFPITLGLEALAGRTSLGIGSAVGAAAIVFGVALAVGLVAIRDTFASTVRLILVGVRSARHR